MTGIIILCAAAVVLGLLLFTPIRVRAAYDQGDISAAVRFGPVGVTLYPRPETPPEKKKEKKPKKEKPSKEKKKPEARINREQILYTLEKLPPVLGRALKRLGRRVRIEPLKLHLLVAGSDPADTAALYGRLQAALGAGLPILHRVFRIKEQDIRLFPDFQQERMDCIADVGVSLRLWDILVIGLCAGGSVLKWFMGFRKLADKSAGTENDHQKETTGKTGAA